MDTVNGIKGMEKIINGEIKKSKREEDKVAAFHQYVNNIYKMTPNNNNDNILILI